MGSKVMFYCDIMDVHPEVTGSGHLVVAKFPDGRTTKFLVDFGLFQEQGYEEYNRELLFNADELAFCVVTHNHIDHTGRIPFLVRNGFRGNIYTSPDTARLMPLAMADSQKVLRDVAKRQNRKVLYGEDDVFRAEALITPTEYYKEERASENIKIMLLKNGHLVGAAMILVRVSFPGYDDINLLFTGDYHNRNMFFNVPEVPRWIRKLPLTIIQESTYGYMDSNIVVKTFKHNLLNCMKRGGTAIVPVFSLGRAQEILYEIKCMQDEGELSKEIPVYFDGKLAIKYTKLYTQGLLDIRPEMLDFLPANLTFVDKVVRSQILEDEDKKIVVTTSGMGSYGPAQTYIPVYMKRKNALVHFTGYTASGTLGSRLKDALEGEDVEVGGLVVKKCATVSSSTEYSAHAKADEMIEFLKKFENLKLVLVNHGRADVKIRFSKRIVEEVDPKNVGVLGREYFFRVDPYGWVKTLPSKFK